MAYHVAFPGESFSLLNEDNNLSEFQDKDKEVITDVPTQLQPYPGTSDRQLKRAGWDDFSGKYGLPKAFLLKLFPQHSLLTCYLPPSFHVPIFEALWRAADVYLDRACQRRTAPRVHVLALYLSLLIAPFRGRIIDQPKEPLPETDDTTGQDVKHQVFALGSALFIVIEVELLALNEEENVADLFMEMLSAATINQERKLHARVHGLITDQSRFTFYSYDPLQERFFFDENFFTGGPRERHLTLMIPVSNKIFSVLLAIYIGALKDLVAERRMAVEDGVREALAFAREAQTILTSRADDLAALEMRGAQGLEITEKRFVLHCRLSVLKQPV
ncbi:uncharacterized protein PHACADRAFT_204752 [Phanerochaete carnosa HHB-10118-sp]|uniref:Uncharacterized protein n=1 Tax=Phanerochaete carnosa (strain HHB-10118-sp) TaxID=650164 RepID=K5WQ29_PHACS|nr:uncharacterized protein PHACADRAFT_204752 [Phanerochaete carnosa HHB-10118-sp]EKM61585.1 hypothetical protein PHACADRAFT_204752 [Phanerochaete carnosa HHB-10118-sp]